MSKSPMHNTAFDVITQKYCRYFDVQSPKQFTLEQWYRVIAEGTLELAYGKPAAKKNGRHVNYLSMEFLIGRLTGTLSKLIWQIMMWRWWMCWNKCVIRR